MSEKRIKFDTAPRAPSGKNAWVEESAGSRETTRLTLDLSTALHRRIKMDCARRGKPMREDIEALLEEHYPKETSP